MTNGLYILTTLRNLWYLTKSNHSGRKKSRFGIFPTFQEKLILMGLSIKNIKLHSFCPARSTYLFLAFFEYSYMHTNSWKRSKLWRSSKNINGSATSTVWGNRLITFGLPIAPRVRLLERSWSHVAFDMHFPYLLLPFSTSVYESRICTCERIIMFYDDFAVFRVIALLVSGSFIPRSFLFSFSLAQTRTVSPKHLRNLH